MSDNVLLTRDDIEAWRREYETLESEIAAKQAKLSLLERKLEAAALFMGTDQLQSSRQSKDVGPEPKELKPMPGAVLDIVKTIGGTVLRAQIKSALLEAGYPEQRLGNYFYTVLNRLEERGDLVKRGDGYYLPRRIVLPKIKSAPLEDTNEALS